MPTTHHNDIFNWGRAVINHVRRRQGFEHPCKILCIGPRYGGVAANFVCEPCNTWFYLRSEALILDDTVTMPDPLHITVIDFLKTDWGRAQLSKVLLEQADRGLRKGVADREDERPFDADYIVSPLLSERERLTSWEHILKDDE